MNEYDNHAEGIRILQDVVLGDDCPSLFFNGQSIKILPGGVRLKRENTAGGFSLDSDIQLTCLSADFGVVTIADAQKLSKQTFLYPGKTGSRFSIASATLMPTGIQLRINGDNAGKL